MTERSSNRVLWIVLIIVGLLVSCGLGMLLGGVVGYAVGRNATQLKGQMPFEVPEKSQQLVPDIEIPIPPITIPELPEELIPFDWEERGALVVEVIADSPADDAGLRVGDLIIAVDDQPVGDKADLAAMISDYKPGDRIKLDIIRRNRERTIEVELGRNEDGGPWLGIRYRAFPLMPDMSFRSPKRQFEFDHWSS